MFCVRNYEIRIQYAYINPSVLAAFQYDSVIITLRLFCCIVAVCRSAADLPHFQYMAGSSSSGFIEGSDKHIWSIELYHLPALE